MGEEKNFVFTRLHEVGMRVLNRASNDHRTHEKMGRGGK